MQKGQQLLQAASLALFLILTAQLGRGGEPLALLSVSTALAGVACVTGVSLLKALEKKFTYEDYNHAK